MNPEYKDRIILTRKYGKDSVVIQQPLNSFYASEGVKISSRLQPVAQVTELTLIVEKSYRAWQDVSFRLTFDALPGYFLRFETEMNIPQFALGLWDGQELFFVEVDHVTVVSDEDFRENPSLSFEEEGDFYRRLFETKPTTFDLRIITIDEEVPKNPEPFGKIQGIDLTIAFSVQPLKTSGVRSRKPSDSSDDSDDSVCLG